MPNKYNYSVSTISISIYAFSSVRRAAFALLLRIIVNVTACNGGKVSLLVAPWRSGMDETATVFTALPLY